MYKILCPTDFSPNSEFAIEYAINISNVIKAKLVFVSSFKVPRISGRLGSMDEKLNEFMWEDLKYFADKFKELITTGLEPELAVVEGNTTTSILHYAKEHQIDLIIMGTKGSSSISKMILGSITKKFFELSTIPVLAIPQVTKERLTGNNILLSMDNKGIHNKHSIELLKTLKTLPETKLNVIHISKKEEKISLDNNTKLLAEYIDEIIDLEGDDAVKMIKDYTDENEVGILAMVGRKHTFLERLFFETNTVAELFATNVPILILPEE